MIGLCYENGQYKIIDRSKALRGKHINQIQFWQFVRAEDRTWYYDGDNFDSTLNKLLKYFKTQSLEFDLDANLNHKRQRFTASISHLNNSLELGKAIKNGAFPGSQNNEFLDFVNNNLSRKLKPHQLKAAIHLLQVGNAANFSVPGSGKTTVVLAVYAWLREQGIVNSLFVVGPPSCFRPWRDEFSSTLGYPANFEILAGGNMEERHLKYYRPDSDRADIYLSTFHTLQRDVKNVIYLLDRAENSFFMVIDEAHYIKQQGGSWASAVLDSARFATRRCVLTGTPFPHSYLDAINIFDVLYPEISSISEIDKVKLHRLVKLNKDAEAAEILETSISPLFYRVRKTDLHLAKQNFHKPELVKMGHVERFFYDTILGRIRGLTKEEFFRNLKTQQKLRKGRIMRMRQAISYPKLLLTAIEDYDENLTGDNASLDSKIANYDELETPEKITVLLDKISLLKDSNQKVVVWSNFIGTLHLIKRCCLMQGWKAEIISGETPTEDKYSGDILTRESIIDDFKAEGSGMDILIANPAACAESISLHRACSNAIYYDLSYNCAQYLQSIDRIHRVGGSENKESDYYFLQYENTFENDILENVLLKHQNMSKIIDKEFPVYEQVDFDNDLNAYERIFK